MPCGSIPTSDQGKTVKVIISTLKPRLLEVANDLESMNFTF